jgi:hypothetical protein
LYTRVEIDAGRKPPIPNESNSDTPGADILSGHLHHEDRSNIISKEGLFHDVGKFS